MGLAPVGTQLSGILPSLNTPVSPVTRSALPILSAQPASPASVSAAISAIAQGRSSASPKAVASMLSAAVPIAAPVLPASIAAQSVQAGKAATSASIISRVSKTIPGLRVSGQAPAALSALYDNSGRGVAAAAAKTSVEASIRRSSKNILKPAALQFTAAPALLPAPQTRSSQATPRAFFAAAPLLLGLATALQADLGLVFGAVGFPIVTALTHAILTKVFAKAEEAPSAAGLWIVSSAAGLGFGAYTYVVSLLSPWAAAASVAAIAIAAVALLWKSGGDAPKAPASQGFSKDGFLRLSRNEKGKLLLTLKEEDLDKPLMLNAMMEKGVGEGFLYSMSPLAEAMVVFHRSGDRIQLLRKNMAYRAAEGSADAKVVSRAFQDSVIASVPVAAKDAKAKSVTVSMDDILLTDLFDLQGMLAGTFPESGGYALAKELSRVDTAKTFPKNAELSAELLFLNGNPGQELPVPDARSLTLRMRYSFSALPEPGFTPRSSDERIGFFNTVYRDFTDLNSKPAAETPHGNLANRWRLEKTDPSAKVSPVKQPIVWWLENTIPQEYREAVRDGILKWNAAFEKAGFQDAIVVRQQPDEGVKPADQAEAQFDPADVRYNVVHWFTGSDADIAFAMWHTDPRTGEIYNGHVNFSLQVLDGSGYRGMREVLEDDHAGHKHGPSCRAGHETAQAIEALKHTPLSAQERAKFTNDLVVSYVVHEVGHALGLRHNFAATSMRTLDEIAEAKDGIVSQSVMDYAAISIPADEVKDGVYVQTELGPYDYLAVEYGYRQFADAKQAQKELSRLAGRIGEPGLEFATDEQVDGTDPYTAQFDFGPEPLEFAVQAADRARRGMDALAKRQLNEGADYGSLRRHFNFLRGQLFRAFRLVMPYVGGIHVNRVRAGQNAGKLPYEAVSGAKQRAAMDFLRERLFSDEALALPQGLLARLAPDLRETLNNPSPESDVLPYEELVTDLRKSTIDSLLAPTRLKRMAESRQLAEDDYYSPRELFADLTSVIWSEVLEGKGELNISPLRRRAQAAYVRKLLSILQGPSGLEEDEQGRLREPKNPYTSESMAAASAEMYRIMGAVAGTEHPGKGKKKPTRRMDADTAEHLEHLLMTMGHALGQ